MSHAMPLPFDEEIMELFESCLETGEPFAEALAERPDLTEDCPDLAARVKVHVEEVITGSILSLADIQFRVLLSTGVCGPLGWGACEESYLALPSHLDVTPPGLSAEQLQEIERNWTADVMGRAVPVSRDSELSEILECVGSPKRVMTAMESSRWVVIYGDCACLSDRDGNRLLHFTREDAWTPISTLRISAHAAPGRLVIREAVCRRIVQTKWMPYVDAAMNEEGFPPGEGPMRRIYDAFSTAAAAAFIEALGPDVEEGLAEEAIRQAHLFNDGFIAMRRLLGAEYCALAQAIEARSGIRHGINDALRTCVIYSLSLVDLVVTSLQDAEKARRGLLMLVCDNLFGESPELENYSSLLLACVASSIKANGSVSFRALSETMTKTYRLLEDSYLLFLKNTGEQIRDSAIKISAGREILSPGEANRQIEHHIRRQRPPSRSAEDDGETYNEQLAWWHGKLALLEQSGSTEYQVIVSRFRAFDEMIARKLLEELDPGHGESFKSVRDYLIAKLATGIDAGL